MYYQEKVKSPLITSISITIFIFAGIVAGFLFTRIFFTHITVSDESMEPNFSTGERVIVLKVSSPKKGDVVLIKSPVEDGRVLLKRVVAEENDLVEIKNKTIYINNIEFKPSWKVKSLDKRVFTAEFSNRDNMPPVKIKRKEFFVIGDNLDFSFDSRNFGATASGSIIGKLFYHIK